MKKLILLLLFIPLEELQRAMGHSSLQVSLTYLRGLELKEEDMPVL